MGRFGDVLLVGGEPELSLTAQLGEVVRLYLTNTANTRVFKVALPGARMKLVGGDSGHVEHEEFVDDVILAPSERVVVDVLFDQPGQLDARAPHPGPDLPARRDHRQREPGRAVARGAVRGPAHNADMAAERERDRALPGRRAGQDRWRSSPRWTWTPRRARPVVYTCPMHPEVVSEAPGHCPECGMKLLAVAAPATTYTCPMHPEVVSEQPDHCPKCGMKLLPAQLVAEAGGHEHQGHDRAHGEHEHAGHDHEAAGGIEWEDDMVEVNRMTTPANMRWKIVDRDDRRRERRDRLAVPGRRPGEDPAAQRDGRRPSDAPPVPHPRCRPLPGARPATACVESNLVWKDTVLVRTGETVDILLDVTNLGVWMAHCHIAEHHESGMMFSFHVDPSGGDEHAVDGRDA